MDEGSMTEDTIIEIITGERRPVTELEQLLHVTYLSAISGRTLFDIMETIADSLDVFDAEAFHIFLIGYALGERERLKTDQRLSKPKTDKLH